jgi:hypothetical protein
MSFYVQRIYHQPLTKFDLSVLCQKRGFEVAKGGFFVMRDIANCASFAAMLQKKDTR